MAAVHVLKKANGAAGSILFKPFVVMAARVLGPGPTRLRLVKLAHNLSGTNLVVVQPDEAAVESATAAAQPSTRAA